MRDDEGFTYIPIYCLGCELAHYNSLDWVCRLYDPPAMCVDMKRVSEKCPKAKQFRDGFGVSS